MNAITFDPAATTLVNMLTCDPTDQTALIDLLRQNTDTVIATLDGWRSTSRRPEDRRRRDRRRTEQSRRRRYRSGRADPQRRRTPARRDNRPAGLGRFLGDMEYRREGYAHRRPGGAQNANAARRARPH